MIVEVEYKSTPLLDVAFSILYTKEIYDDLDWNLWADRWLLNLDRTAISAIEASLIHRRGNTMRQGNWTFSGKASEFTAMAAASFIDKNDSSAIRYAKSAADIGMSMPNAPKSIEDFDRIYGMAKKYNG